MNLKRGRRLVENLVKAGSEQVRSHGIWAELDSDKWTADWAGLTNGVAQFADGCSTQYALPAQQVGDEAADDHDQPHDKVWRSRQ